MVFMTTLEFTQI